MERNSIFGDIHSTIDASIGERDWSKNYTTRSTQVYVFIHVAHAHLGSLVQK